MKKILIGALAAACCTATLAAGAASFLDGFSKGMRQAQESSLIDAETERLNLESSRLKRERKDISDAKQQALLADFSLRWKPQSNAVLTPIEKRQRAKPEEWSDDSLSLATAKPLSENIIEVYRVSDMSPALVKLRKWGSTVDRLVIDCKKGTITGLEIAFFPLSNGLGAPTDRVDVFEIFTKPFPSTFWETVYDKSCYRLSEINWDSAVANAIAVAKATDNLDYRGNADLSKELDALVRTFAQEATNSGMTDEGLVASKWALEQALSVMRTRHKIGK